MQTNTNLEKLYRATAGLTTEQKYEIDMAIIGCLSCEVSDEIWEKTVYWAVARVRDGNELWKREPIGGEEA